MSKKQYSELAIGIDLISDAYDTNNPVIIAEKLKEDLELSATIHQVSDYMEVSEDFELESRKVYYNTYY